MSLLLSRYDARVIVLRNGVEIGRARVRFRDPETPLGTHVFVAKDVPGSGAGRMPEWIGVGVVGHLDDANTRPDPDTIRRIELPHDFLALVTPHLVGGTALMVTDAPVLEHNSGMELAVLSSHPGPGEPVR